MSKHSRQTFSPPNFKNLNESILSQIPLSERKYASKQLKQIFAVEMSKTTSELQHLTKISENKRFLENSTIEDRHNQKKKIETKLQTSASNKNMKLDSKSKHIRVNEEHWRERVKLIRDKMQSEVDQRFQQSKRISQEAENFWKRRSLEKMMHNQTINASSGNRWTHCQQVNYTEPISLEKASGKFKRLSHRKVNSNSQLDELISVHKVKSQEIQAQKEQAYIHKFVQKMIKLQNIEHTKGKKDASQDKAEPRFNSVQRSLPQQGQSIYKEKPKSPDRSQGHHRNYSMDEQYNDLTYSQIKAFNVSRMKEMLDNKEFLRRGQLLQKSFRKHKEERIKQFIKGKVRLMKLEAVKHHAE